MPGETILNVKRPLPPSMGEIPAALKALKKTTQSTVNVVAQFKSPEGDSCGPPLNLPANIGTSELSILINNLLKNVRN